MIDMLMTYSISFFITNLLISFSHTIHKTFLGYKRKFSLQIVVLEELVRPGGKGWKNNGGCERQGNFPGHKFHCQDISEDYANV